jgi:hypothetical protein
LFRQRPNGRGDAFAFQYADFDREACGHHDQDDHGVDDHYDDDHDDNHICF